MNSDAFLFISGLDERAGNHGLGGVFRVLGTRNVS